MKSLNDGTAAETQAALASLGHPHIAAHSARFLQAHPGGYGEGDRFRGLRVPAIRKVARQFRSLPLDELARLLRSLFHEDRLCALVILVERFARTEAEQRLALYELYMANLDYVNNWDLVDTSAGPILGGYLSNRDRQPLYVLADSPDLWKRRIAIMATFHFIKNGDFADTFELVDRLLRDPEDLIHKAAGWMLREIGNRDGAAERAFLEKRYRVMPRTMLRYAIEKFPAAERKRYLAGTV